ncbi:MAG: DUF4167 domain-containing protein [Hyphomicrobiales bacterium]|nr:DUF4167 domain-containing protein [Hyphomicrobiales bacterium]
MRQQQQRSRNRNRGRKSSNPLSRNFESNGPDVKIRGNANHIAEKYSVLARDALTSGDTVMAENYFQHAEHYFRIIAATQPNIQNNSNRDNDKTPNNSQNDDADTGETTNTPENARGEGPQPDLDIAPAEIVLEKDASAVREESGENGDEASYVGKAAKPDIGRNRRNGRKPVGTRRASRSVSKKDEEPSPSKQAHDGLSKDAALLPSSLIGTKKENEAENVPPHSED